MPIQHDEKNRPWFDKCLVADLDGDFAVSLLAMLFMGVQLSEEQLVD
jgi:hypothetical protein